MKGEDGCVGHLSLPSKQSHQTSQITLQQSAILPAGMLFMQAGVNPRAQAARRISIAGLLAPIHSGPAVALFAKAGLLIYEGRRRVCWSRLAVRSRIGLHPSHARRVPFLPPRPSLHSLRINIDDRLNGTATAEGSSIWQHNSKLDAKLVRS
jgi:hypothetical protein